MIITILQLQLLVNHVSLSVVVIVHRQLLLLSLNLLNSTASEHEVHEATFLDLFHIDAGTIRSLDELAARVFTEGVGAVHLQNDGLRENQVARVGVARLEYSLDDNAPILLVLERMLELPDTANLTLYNCKQNEYID